MPASVAWPVRTRERRTVRLRAVAFVSATLFLLASVGLLAGCRRDCSTGHYDADTGTYVDPEQCEKDTDAGWIAILVFVGGIAWVIYATNGRDPEE